MQTYTRSQEWALVFESKSRMPALEGKGKQDNDQVASSDAKISKWQQEIKESQSKIQEEERKKAESQNANLASQQPQLEEEAKAVIQHFNNTHNLDGEIEQLTAIETLIDTRIKLAKLYSKG